MARVSVLLASVASILGAPVTAQDAPPAVDPAALQALFDMSERMRGLDSFTITADIASEVVLVTGERLTSIDQVLIDAHKGTNLRIEKTSPTRERIFYFNGESATLWGPVTQFYATTAFSGTNADLIAHLSQTFGYEVPLSDLFLLGTGTEDAEAVTQARYIRPANIGGRVCGQFAYRFENVDLQMWIDTAEGGLPCAYQIVDRTDDASPTFFATLEVETIVNLDDNRFTFVPPEDAIAIQFETVAE
ncbi:DUF2092 domain-containing protein [Tateyamaria pelophila]|uniref:DUF2092 domain-containing protein n=1 Tax=Tateyamaria pelophila TaxID=328415 RepID=UPI001CBA9053|nr:DUF2092 domain-containing protein [Tateyamaria pelophila]